MAATDVRLDGTARTGPDLSLVGRRADYFHTQLMAQNPRIGEKRLAAREGMQVGSTHANAMNAHKGFARIGFHRRGELFLELPGLFEYDLTHKLDGISLARVPSFLLT